MENKIILMQDGIEYELDLNEPSIKSFMDLLSKKGYGEVYFRVGIDEDKGTYPTEIILDGVTYDVTNHDQVEKLKKVLEKMKEAVEFVEQNYTSFETLPKHINSDVYQYHPRWMVMRRLNGLIPEPENTIRCGMKQILTKESWERYCFLSVGQNPMKTPGIDSKQKLTEEEYAMATLDNTCKSSIEYERMFFREFMANYIGDPKNTIKLEYLFRELCNANNDNFFEAVRNLHGEAVKVSNNTVEEILPALQAKQYHRDLLAFQDTIAVALSSSSKMGVKLKYAKDGFPVLGFKGQKYDLRKPTDESRFEYDFCKKYGFSRTLKSVG